MTRIRGSGFQTRGQRQWQERLNQGLEQHIQQKQSSVEIKRTQSAQVIYGDHASESYSPAQYGIFREGKQVGFIYGSDKTYMGPARHWTVCSESGRELKRFYQPNALRRAKDFAMTYPWQEELNANTDKANTAKE